MTDTTSRMEQVNYRAWNIAPLSSFEISKEGLLLHLVGWAVLAPNSHNAQPWRFIIDPRTCSIGVCVDGSYILPVSDAAGRQAYISVGCALGNLVAAADAYGLSFEVIYHEGYRVYPDPVATVCVGPQRANAPICLEMLGAMKERRMLRCKYDPIRPVPEALRTEAESITRNAGLVLDCITDAATRFAIAEFQYRADRTVIMWNKFRSELARFLLPNDTICARGMPGDTFGLDNKMALRVHDELGKTGSFDPHLAFGFAVSGRDGIKSAPAIFVISVADDSPYWWVQAGSVLEKIVLAAERHGCAVAMHAAAVEVKLSNTLLRLRLRRKERPTVVCRIGYATEQRPHSPRLDAEMVSEIKNN